MANIGTKRKVRHVTKPVRENPVQVPATPAVPATEPIKEPTPV